MQSKEKPQFARPPAHDTAAARRGNKILKAGACVVTSAVTAWALACLPVAAGSNLAALGAAPAYLTTDAVNRPLKGDRLVRAGFDARWNALAAAMTNSNGGRRLEPRAAKRVEQRIPLGCEPAFSRLVVAGNFSTRCLAVLERASAAS
jgi:hypothetical protein